MVTAMVDEKNDFTAVENQLNITGDARYSWVAGLGFLTIWVAVILLCRLVLDLTSFQRTALTLIEVITVVGFSAASIDWLRAGGHQKITRYYAWFGLFSVVIRVLAVLWRLLKL